MIIWYSSDHPHPDDMTRDQRMEAWEATFATHEWANTHTLWALVNYSREDTLAYRMFIKGPIRIKAIPR